MRRREEDGGGCAPNNTPSSALNLNSVCFTSHQTMWRPAFNNILLHLLLVVNLSGRVEPNPDAKRLYDDLLSNYNRLIRSDRRWLWLCGLVIILFDCLQACGKQYRQDHSQNGSEIIPAGGLGKCNDKDPLAHCWGHHYQNLTLLR